MDDGRMGESALRSGRIRDQAGSGIRDQGSGIRPGEIRPGEIRPGEIRPGEIRPSEIR